MVFCVVLCYVLHSTYMQYFQTDSVYLHADAVQCCAMQCCGIAFSSQGRAELPFVVLEVGLLRCAASRLSQGVIISTHGTAVYTGATGPQDTRKDA